MKQIVAMVVLETDDVRIRPCADTAGLRSAVVAALPGLSRVIAIMSEPEARLMIGAHMIAAQESGLHVETTPVRRPGDKLH